MLRNRIWRGGGGLLLDMENAAAIERANAIRPTAQDEAMMKEMGW